MSKKVSYVIDRVRRILQDAPVGDDGVRWRNSELFDWINDAQRAIVEAHPQAKAVTEDVSLVAGTLQKIPVAGVTLIKAVRNTGGRAIQISEQSVFDNEDPDWHDPQNPAYANKDLSVVKNYFFNDSMPRQFYVYPPNDGNGSLELTYSSAPNDIGDLDDDIDVNEIYVNQIVDYVLYRCYMKDVGNQMSADRAARHYQLFREALGLKAQADLRVSPQMAVEQSRAQQQ